MIHGKPQLDLIWLHSLRYVLKEILEQITMAGNSTVLLLKNKANKTKTKKKKKTPPFFPPIKGHTSRNAGI